MALVFLAMFVALGVLVAGIILLPLVWIGSIHLPGWLWLGVFLVLFSWGLGD